MAITLADIARELGVSKMTVSRAINNHPLINSQTRERVLEVARRLNYQPNQHARALATNRSYLIGVVVPDLMNLYFAEVTRAIESVTRPAGFQLLICSTEEDATRELDQVEALLHRTDGLIISSVLKPTDTSAYRKLIKDGARIVLVDRTMKDLRSPSVATDNVRVGKLATEHLINLGHRRIGHLCGDASSVSVERFEGYKQALAKRKLRYVQSQVRRCGLLESEGYTAMRGWLAEGNVPDAIFAVNDPAAIGAMQAMEEAGVRVGDEIALVGAGNIHYGDMLRTPLTTVSWSRNEMGQQAARLLIGLIDNELTRSKPQTIVLPPELVIRNSCGAKPFVAEDVSYAARFGMPAATV
ncbi:MAG TPA: LacI family DNA-binding transcriptional regulator [Blastocatellia bacterium]|nr:LacI family DNA-binding transcriptional regulator [Blastocatellia bacterium]